MDDTQKNEAVLEEFLQRTNKKFVAQVGVIALALLTQQMSTAQFQSFLRDCIDNAVDAHKIKSLGLASNDSSNEDPTSPQQ